MAGADVHTLSKVFPFDNMISYNTIAMIESKKTQINAEGVNQGQKV